MRLSNFQTLQYRHVRINLKKLYLDQITHIKLLKRLKIIFKANLLDKFWVFVTVMSIFKMIPLLLTIFGLLSVLL